jgi:magnesium transporter
LKVLWRELAAGALLGVVLGAVGVVRVILWELVFHAYGEHYIRIGFTVGASLVGIVLLGTLCGSMLPFALKRLKLDPASASAPMVATLVDVGGVVIYFLVASIILRGTLL